jgi:transposase-like protein
MSRNTARKRKRQKLKCSVCNRTFDDDYRLEHNQKYHPLYQKEIINVIFVGAYVLSIFQINKSLRVATLCSSYNVSL